MENWQFILSSPKSSRSHAFSQNRHDRRVNPTLRRFLLQKRLIQIRVEILARQILHMSGQLKAVGVAPDENSLSVPITSPCEFEISIAICFGVALSP